MLRGVNPRMSDFHALAFFQKLKELYLSFGAHTAPTQKAGFRASYDSFVVKKTVVLRINICDKNPPLRQAANR